VKEMVTVLWALRRVKEMGRSEEDKVPYVEEDTSLKWWLAHARALPNVGG
jgi:hypothetical protein